jgi:formylglycine-generating enzyme required for sulfatase activity
MLLGKVSRVLLGAGLLLVSEPERGLLPRLSVSSAAQPGLRTGQVFRDRMKNGTNGPEMAVIPAGRFRMGDIQGKGAKDEQPVHEVHISKRFGMSRYEITFDQYDEFAKATRRDLPEDEGFGRGRRPVIRVSWNDALDYAEWLTQQTGKRYRLPTEAQWEYAARAGTETVHWWGNEKKPGFANCIGCGSRWDNKQTAPVGSFKPNPFGLYDTAGNVLEWV